MTRTLRTVSRLGGALLLALGLAFTPSCDHNTTYSYFSVNATVDMTSVPRELLDMVNSAALYVSGADEDSTDLGWRRGGETWSIGRVEWSTRATTGTVTFRVALLDANRRLLAEGFSEPVAVVPNVDTPVAIVVRSALPSEDAGAPSDGPALRTDGAVPSDAATGNADAAADAGVTVPDAQTGFDASPTID